MINTHSPGVVGNVPEGSLLLADLVLDELVLRPMKNTWRENIGRTIQKADLIKYLQPISNVSIPGEAGRSISEAAGFQLRIEFND